MSTNMSARCYTCHLTRYVNQAFDAKATKITQKMKLSAAKAIASLVGDDELDENYVIPSPFDKRVAQAVAKAVADMAIEEGVVR